MASSIDYKTRIISIPKSDLTLVQSDHSKVYEFDVDAFRLELKDIEDSVAGISFVDTHFSSVAITAEGGIVGRVFEIINGYTITFEDGDYTVNIVGANTNIAEVTNSNQVQIRGTSSTTLAKTGAYKHLHLDE